jgi:Initiator Replication protein
MSAIQPRDEKVPAIKTPQELIHIKHKITLLQYKYWVLMLRAYREAYEVAGRHLTDEEFCYIPMQQLEEHMGYTPKISEIERDLEAIRIEPITYNVLEKDKQKAKIGRGFIGGWYVSRHRIGVVFPPLIREAVGNLDHRESIFHLLNWSIFNSFSGKYEAILYKLCKDYVGSKNGTKEFSLTLFREYMGVKENEYPDFKRLNQWVISGPIKNINKSEISDITIRVEFTKEKNRKVVGLKFYAEHKQQTSMPFDDEPSFRLARVTVSLEQQKKYLLERSSEDIELSIERANEYADEQGQKGKEVDLGKIYRKAITENWGTEFQSRKAREAEQAAKKEKQVKTIEHKKQADETKAQAEKIEGEAIWTEFLTRPESERIAIADTVIGTNNFMRQAYTKSGIEAVIVKMPIIVYLKNQAKNSE